MTAPVPPPDFLERCLSTIPASATYAPPAPRLTLAPGSRKRLVWLTLAAAIPAITVLAVLPAKRLLDARRPEPVLKQQKSDRPRRNNELVPYVRIERWVCELKNYTAAPPEYRVIIYDNKRGRSEWVTDKAFTNINDAAPLAHLQARHGKTYTSYYKANGKCYVFHDWVTEKGGLNGYVGAYNPDSAVGMGAGLEQQSHHVTGDTAEWNGKEVKRYIFQSMTDVERAEMLAELHIIAARKKIDFNRFRTSVDPNTVPWRCAVYVDPGTGRVLGSRTWAYLKGTEATDPNGVPIGETNFYYEPRPDDAQFFDAARIQRGVRVVQSKTKYGQ